MTSTMLRKAGLRIIFNDQAGNLWGRVIGIDFFAGFQTTSEQRLHPAARFGFGTQAHELEAAVISFSSAPSYTGKRPFEPGFFDSGLFSVGWHNSIPRKVPSYAPSAISIP